MTTDYDPIAEQYQRSKQQPWRIHVEAHTLMALIGDPTGNTVLDVACGEGFYTRRLRQQGAAAIVGVDLSEGMIELARKQEAKQQLGIDYRVGDARSLSLAEKYDLVGPGCREPGTFRIASVRSRFAPAIPRRFFRQC